MSGALSRTDIARMGNPVSNASQVVNMTQGGTAFTAGKKSPGDCRG